MQNPIPKPVSEVFTLAEKAGDGCHTHEVALGIMHNTEALVRADLATARTANQEYQAAKGAKVVATGSQSTADADAVAYIMAARDVLKPRLGTRWSAAWNQAGFINASLEVPSTLAQRMELVKSLELYFTSHAAHEVATLNVTAARAATVHAAFSTGASGANAARSEQVAKRDARDAAVETLRKRLRGLIAELEQLLGEDDERWLDFGFNIPSAGQTPEAPTGLTLRGGAPGHLVASWPATARATHFRVYKQVVGQPGDFVLAATVGDTDADLNTFASGVHVRVQVTAVNTNGESQPSETVEQVVP